MMRIESKLPSVGTSIFSVMTQLAERHQAVNLSQGFPDFEPPPRLIELVGEHLAGGHNQYAPMAGVPALREAIAAKLKRIYGIQVDAENDVTVAPGATQAIFCAIQAIIRPGDEVLVFDPAYDCYEPAITLAGGSAVHLPLTLPDFSIDWERLDSALSDKTRLLILNTPHNPSGAMLSASDLNAIAERLRRRRCWILSDEVYEHIVFDGRSHVSVLSNAELAERAFVVSSFGKTYHATGWKIGYCIAPRDLTAQLRRIHQYVSFATVTPIQHALAQFMHEDPTHELELPQFYQARRDEFCALLSQTRFEFVPTSSTYFQLAQYRQLSDQDDVSFARWLTETHGVATIPVSVFCAAPFESRFIRFCFAKRRDTLATAVARLAEI